MLEEAMLRDIKIRKKIRAATQQSVPRIEFTTQEAQMRLVHLCLKILEKNVYTYYFWVPKMDTEIFSLYM